MTLKPDDLEMVIFDILKKELSLDDVHIFLEKKFYESSQKYPNVKDMVVFVTYFCQDRLRFKDNQKAEIIKVDLLSRDFSAQTGVMDIQMALKSKYAREQQEKFNINILNTSEPMDLSSLEGKGIRCRYEINITVLNNSHSIDFDSRKLSR